MATGIAWTIWSIIAIGGLCVELFLVFASTAVPGASMFWVVLIAIVSVGACVGLSLRLMLRRNFGVGILLACLLLPLTFTLGIGLEKSELMGSRSTVK